jgi:hypothetical protein
VDYFTDDLVQQQQQQQPVVVIKPEDIRVTWGSVIPGSGQPSTPVSPEVNATLNSAMAQMASNLVNGMIAAANIEQNPVTSQQSSVTNSQSVSLQVELSPSAVPGATLSGSSETNNSTTVEVQTTADLLTKLGNANDTLQAQLYQNLSGMSSPTAGKPEGELLGQAGFQNAPDGASAFADSARSKANEIARDFYTKAFPGRPLPKAFLPASILEAYPRR